MGQYFENDNNLDSKITKISYTYYGHMITYSVDLGVFSKDRVDFGTNALLKALPVFNAEDVLDVGCGYGAIGLAVAKAYPKTKVTMVDVNLRAISLALANKSYNKINNVNIFESNMYENVKDKFDYILSNPPIRAGKKIVHGIVEEGYNSLKDGGKIIVVIQKKQGAPSMKIKLEEVYGNVETIYKDSGYFVFMSEKAVNN